MSDSFVCFTKKGGDYSKHDFVLRYNGRPCAGRLKAGLLLFQTASHQIFIGKGKPCGL
ncbi:hypothetical protein [Kingella potus]|uniref:hypothetical protein n=1 Tax=Kingella potus TaxID=265175 RepID=UPI0015592A30|nr:hypothetical protein [Kingella potus]